MTSRRITIACLGVLLGASVAAADPMGDAVEQLRKIVEEQQQSIKELKARIQQLETQKAAPAAAKAPAPPPTPVAAAPTAPSTGEAPSPAETEEAKVYANAKKSPVPSRGNLDDRQEAAALPGDYVLDPAYRGYIPIPQTVFMVKFNPKPRLDMMFTTRNPGDSKFRFAPAILALGSSPGSTGEQFDATSNGSQLRVDLRAPSMPGNFRLYYQNDFFGSDTSQMKYRLQHFFGQYHGVVGGFTYGVFEDPDSWPDTVDYEGPNALIFARRPLLHYIHEIAPDWAVTVGLEEPAIAVDTTGAANASSQQKAPDAGFNVRWTPGDLGHMQFSTILRALSVRGAPTNDDTAMGWGLNLSGSFNVTPADTLQFLGVVGEGIGGLGNDSGFANTDAALNKNGGVEALGYVSGLGAFSHDWTPRWRTTGTFGYVRVDNTSMQSPTAYHMTRYGSLNLVYKVYKRLSVGLEGLYGFREVHNGDDTKDVARVNLGMVYSPFD